MEYLHNLLYVVIAGAFGGMLYAIKNKRIMIPFVRRSTQRDEITKKDIKRYESIELGIIADLLFGIGGGLLIFLITPAAPDPKENFGMIKLLSLAIVGGYSGQFLVKKVSNNSLESLSSKIEETEKSLSKIERVKENDQRIYRMFYEIIDGSPFEIENMRESLKYVSQSVRLRGCTLLDDRRKELVSKILEHKNAPVEKIQAIKGEFERLIPLLAEIIKSEELYNENEIYFLLNYHYASLAYMYKDKNNPDWELALFFIKKAINIHSKKHKNIDTPETYILNKLLCLVNMDKQEEAVSCFKKLWELPGGRYELIRANSILAPKIHTWISKYYPEEIKDQFLKNENYCEYKPNWVELFPESREFRGC
jgi:tetratricopeptide (TPR) repeat protein